MSQPIEITPCGALDASIRPPGSKSITNRALVCAALARGHSTLTGALVSEDTLVMRDALVRLGIGVRPTDDDAVHSGITGANQGRDAASPSGETLAVEGCDGRLPAASAELYVANSGTTVRFLTALVALGPGPYRLSGTRRMHERPIADLLAALGQLGIRARSESAGGCPPVVVEGGPLAGGEVNVRGDVSSQFLSGLLLAAPYAKSAVELMVEGSLVSQPYVAMTIEVMRAFGVEVSELPKTNATAGQLFHVPRDSYRACRYAIEPDASAASYFFAAAAIAGGQVTVEGLSRRSLQGDVALVDVLQRMGCQVVVGNDSITVRGGALRGVDVNMNAISDTAQTLGAVALFAKGPTRIDGIGHIRHKETDRIAALATELRKLGAGALERADGLTIVPGELRPADIATYDDHRMAMSLALVGLRVPGVRICNPECTAKTYPRFFEDLARVSGARTF